MIVRGGGGEGFLRPSSRVPGGMVLDEIDSCINCKDEKATLSQFLSLTCP